MSMLQVLLIDLDGVIRIWNPEHDRQIEQAMGFPAGTILRTAFSRDVLYPAITGHR